MQDSFGQHGWREFHRNRKNILAEFDKLIEQTSNRPVQTAHGPAVEAYLRKWLSEFLPKKYAVTSGYIIPNLFTEIEHIYHFDIIVYKNLDAPILWTEGNEDNSEQGKYRAIPAQHVVAVYEVKSRLTKKNVAEALVKLDQPSAFKDQLSTNYSCGVIFIDLKQSENESHSIIAELHKGKDVHGFSGGMVLRYENDHSATGLIYFSKSDGTQTEAEPLLSPLAKSIDTLNIVQTEDGSVQIRERGAGVKLVRTAKDTWSISKSYGPFLSQDGSSVYLSWSRSNFSSFCINLLSALEGLSYDDKNRPSFGRIFDSVRLDPAPAQPTTPMPGYPYLTVALHEGGSGGEKLSIIYEDDAALALYWISVTNEGEAEMTMSDDMFKTSLVLPVGRQAMTPVKYKLNSQHKDRGIEDLLENEGVEIPLRYVYKAGPDNKELFAVDKVIKIHKSDICIL